MTACRPICRRCSATGRSSGLRSAWLALLALGLLSAPAAPARTARGHSTAQRRPGVQVCGDILPMPATAQLSGNDPNGLVRRQVDGHDRRGARRRDAEVQRKRAEERACWSSGARICLAQYLRGRGGYPVPARPQGARNWRRSSPSSTSAAGRTEEDEALRTSEFYLNKPMPTELRKDISGNQADIAALRYTTPIAARTSRRYAPNTKTTGPLPGDHW